jgi:hypothetical protein
MEAVEKKTESDILNALAHYHGTEEYHKFSALTSLVLTDGAKALCEMCKSYWFMDIIASYQGAKLEKKTDGFQVWTVTKTEASKAVVTCDDGNDNIVVTQKIPYTDFPLSTYKVYCANGVILIPDEY